MGLSWQQDSDLNAATGLLVVTYALLAISSAIDAYKAYKLKKEIREFLEDPQFSEGGAHQACLRMLQERLKSDPG